MRAKTGHSPSIGKDALASSRQQVAVPACFVAIMILAAFLRLYGLASRSIWSDEAFSIGIAQSPLDTIVTNYFGSVHSPFYYVLLHFWLILGQGEFVVRLLSALLGIAAVGLTFYLGQNLFDPIVGLLGSLFLALSPFHIWYSQTARMYSLLTLLSLLSVLVFLNLLQRRNNSLVVWASFWLITTLNVYTHYFALFVLLAENVFLALHWRRNRGLVRAFLLCQVMVVLALIPWLPTALAQLRLVYLERQLEAGAELVLPGSFYALTLGSLVPDTIPELIVAGLAVLVYGAFLLKGLGSLRTRHQSAQMIVIYLFMPILLIALAVWRVPKLGTLRALVLASPAFALLLGMGVSSIRRPAFRMIAVALAVMVTAVSLSDYYTSDPDLGLRAGSAHIETKAKPSDVILHLNGSSLLAFKYYLGSKMRQYTASEFNQIALVGEGELWGNEAKDLELMLTEERPARIWVVSYQQPSLKQRLLTLLRGEADSTQIPPLESTVQRLVPALIERGYRTSRTRSYSSAHIVQVALYKLRDGGARLGDSRAYRR